MFTMRTDGTAPIALTSHASNDRDPAWSPDGERLAFVSDRDGQNEVYLMNADGSNQRQLTHSGEVAVTLRWSADGRYLWLSRNKDSQFAQGNWQAWIIGVEGATAIDLTQYSLAAVAWRP